MLKVSYTNQLIEAGVDEVGRGCIAGPVVAAAVILPKDYRNGLIKDSKLLTKTNRVLLAEEVKSVAIAYSVGVVSQSEIDRINILQATYKAMHDAIGQLSVTPELLLIDGNSFLPLIGVNHVCVVKGDNTFLSIAAASILAKTYRDSLMNDYSVRYPEYDFGNNKGYLTAKHYEAVFQHGFSPIHRLSFCIKPRQ